MSLCGEASAVKHGEGQMVIASLTCKSWTCDDCAPRRKKRLVAQAIGGAPERFLTLTVNPGVGESPLERRALLAWAWRLIWKRLKRWNPEAEWAFLAVVEKTKAGEPHLHILLRGAYIPQALVSGWMNELIGAPHVYIEAVKNKNAAASYVAKYIGKAPEQFGKFKRYWCSRNWSPKWSPPLDDWLLNSDAWEFDEKSQGQIVREYSNYGWSFRRLRDAVVIGFLPFNEFRPAPT